MATAQAFLQAVADERYVDALEFRSDESSARSLISLLEAWMVGEGPQERKACSSCLTRDPDEAGSSGWAT